MTDLPYNCEKCGKPMVHPGLCCDCMTDSDKLAAAGDSRAWDPEEQYFEEVAACQT